MILGGRWRSLESFWRTRELLCFNNNASLQCNYSFSPPVKYLASIITCVSVLDGRRRSFSPKHFLPMRTHIWKVIKSNYTHVYVPPPWVTAGTLTTTKQQQRNNVVIRISTTFLWPSSFFFFLIIDVRTHYQLPPEGLGTRLYSRMCVWWCDADHDTQSSHPFYMLPVPNGKWTEDIWRTPPRKICLITQTRTLFIFLTLLVITSNGWTWEVDRLHFNILILKFPPKKIERKFFFFSGEVLMIARPRSLD